MLFLKKFGATLTAMTLVVAASAAQPREDDSIEALRKKADNIRESAEKLFKLRRVPWVTDVFEGFRLAKEENRPVFLYMITGDPLGDC